MTGNKEVPEKKYPPEVSYSAVTKGIVGTSLVSSAFHHLMAILLITGLIIDLFGPWVGQWISSTQLFAQEYVGALFNNLAGVLFILVFIVYLVYRGLYAQMKAPIAVTLFIDLLFYIAMVTIGLFAHGFVGALFILVFVIYIAKIVVFNKERMVFTVTNYIDFLLYFILIITGMTLSSLSKPWVDLFPWLFDVLAPIAFYGPAIHILITYVWIVFSAVFPGGIIHGIASAYLISHLKKKSNAEKSGMR